MPQTSFCDYFILKRPERKPDKALLRLLAQDALTRSNEFMSEKRCVDFLWTRLLLVALAKFRGLNASFVENPPYSPKVSDSLFCTITHTSTFVGAALSTSPVAVDLEVIRENRPIAAIAERCFGADFLGLFSQSEQLLAFYKAWGTRECSIKLQAKLVRESREFRVSLDGYEPLGIEHAVLYSKTVSTIASVLTPTVKEMTLADLKESLLS